MRKLASIQKILSITPIDGADAIEKAKVLGWNVVVKKGDFNVGDFCVYCEIDSLMPDKPEFEFLKPRGMRIKTMRLRNTISQGICFPLTILPLELFENQVLSEGYDVTDILGVTKWEPQIPACLGGKVKGLFPSFLTKTDETRVQLLQPLLDKYKGELCYIAEKLDGSSVTYFIRDGEFGVCSRNLELKEDENNSFWKVARDLDIENKLRKFGKNIALQGELIGEGVQKNKYKIKGHTVRFFNIFDIDKHEYFSLSDLLFTLSTLDLTPVPIFDILYYLENDIETLVKLSIFKSKLNPDTWAEGIVIRPRNEKKDEILNGETVGSRISFKVINPEFLLKNNE